jgi:hypothetical protein
MMIHPNIGISRVKTQRQVLRWIAYKYLSLVLNLPGEYESIVPNVEQLGQLTSVVDWLQRDFKWKGGDC